MAAMSNRSMAETPMDVLADDVAIMNTPLVRGFFLVAYLLVFCSCIGGNFLILLVICTQRSMRTATNFYLANLAVADLLVGFFCVFPNAAHFLLFEHYGTWPFGRAACHSCPERECWDPRSSCQSSDLWPSSGQCSSTTLLTKSVLLCSAVMVWGFSLIMNLPYLFAVQFIEMNRKTGGTYGICTRRFLIMADINVLQTITGHLDRVRA
ncbi:Trissin receptor [Aphelenchoides fujianensis]|nr:Trissin receptor [Aphelenchoides fujianensis]